MTTTDATADPASTTLPTDGLAAELRALRDKAGRICDELATLYRRMDELQRQIDAHQQMHRTGDLGNREDQPGCRVIDGGAGDSKQIDSSPTVHR